MKPHFEFFLNKKNLLLITIGSWFCWGFLIGTGPETSLRWPELFADTERYSFFYYIRDMGIYLLASFMLFLLPGLLWGNIFFKRQYRTSELLAVAFIISLALLVVITTFFKVGAARELQSWDLLLMLLAVTGGGLLVCLKKEGWENRNIVTIPWAYFCLCLALLVCLIVAAWGFHEKILWVEYDRDVSPERILAIPFGRQDDVLENFGLIHSLKTHVLPYWDLEYAERYGYSIVDPPLRVFISFFLMLFGGESFAVQSLNTLLVLMLSFWAVARLATVGLDVRAYRFFWLIPVLFLNIIFVFLWHRDFALVLIDHIHVMSLFVVAQVYFLLTGRYRLFLAFAVLAFLTKFEAALFTLAGLWFYGRILQPDYHTAVDLFKKYILLVSLYIVMMLTIGFLRGDLGVYAEAFCVERFVRLDHFHFFDEIFPQELTSPWEAFSLAATWEFFIQFLMGTAFGGVLIFLSTQDKISRFFRRIGLFYLILVLASRTKRIHYISPLVLLSAIIVLRMFFLTSWEDIRGKLRVFSRKLRPPRL